MKYSEPWEYFIADNFLPKDIIEELKILKILLNNLFLY